MGIKVTSFNFGALPNFLHYIRPTLHKRTQNVMKFVQ